MGRLPGWLPRLAGVPLAVAANALFASSASAHVKWFCAYNEAGQPRGLENVLCADFEVLVGLSALALIAGCLFEGTAAGAAVMRAIGSAPAAHFDVVGHVDRLR